MMSTMDFIVPHQHKHCVSCFESCCSGAECAMCNCPDCGVRMHICKLEDHREGGVCLRAMSACPNALYGCTARMRRHALNEHIQGCRLCALDPGSQHLHQLGSLRTAIRNDVQQQQQNQTKSGNVHQTTDTHRSSADYALKFLPTLNRQNALFISPEVSLNVAGVNLNEQFFRTNFPIFACDEFVRRDQFSEHCAAHLAYEDDGLAFFARCPNAQYGCTFHSDHQLLTVDGGLIR
uniref:TRAF-type domain-containing protein n=1 Tax=Globodera pallida TaxID=36090 RepID=A0A183CP71_GLOPA